MIMFFKKTIACRKMLQQLYYVNGSPANYFEKMYKTKKQLYTAIFKSYSKLKNDEKDLIGYVLGFCPLCLDYRKPKDFKTIARMMSMSSAGYALDKYNDCIVGLYFNIHNQSYKDRMEAKKK